MLFEITILTVLVLCKFSAMLELLAELLLLLFASAPAVGPHVILTQFCATK